MRTKRIVLKTSVVCLVAVLMIMSMLAACSKPATTAPATTAAPATTIAPAPTPAPAHWWDKFGEPQYGGEISIASTRLGDNFDVFIPWTSNFFPYEQLFMGDMTIDRSEWSYKVGGPSPKYVGLLAKSWKWEDPRTLVVNLRQNVKWQNKPPVNGREFTADDVVFHYERVLGTGSFTEPNPFSRGLIGPVTSVTAQDKYTVVIKFQDPTPLINWWAITDPVGANLMEPRELVELDSKDWHNAVGTGAFMITDYLPGTSITMNGNPDYYRYDERYPDKRLPYVDTLKILNIADPSTQVAAIRSGQVDLVFDVDWQTAQNLGKTNPKLVASARPSEGFALDLRNDKAPFNDIRVRKALQLAVDTQAIAGSHFGGMVSGNPAGLISTEYQGWALPYEQWSADLQQEYSYNVAEAKKLLAEANYPDGFDTNCYVASEEDVDLLQVIKSNFADVGVNMEIRTMGRNELNAFIRDGKQDQMNVTEFCNMTFPVNVSLYNRTSKCATNSVYAAAAEAAVYDDLHQQFVKAPDEATAQKVALQAQEYALRQHWAVHTTGRVKFDIGQPYIMGWSGEKLNGFSEVWFWTGLWVDQSKK